MRQGTIVDAAIIAAPVFANAGYTGADKRPGLSERDISWNIDQARHYQSLTENSARRGRAN
jgi:hypothetical protein